MKFQQNPVFGFPSRAPLRVLVLKNDIHVSEAFDPSSGLPPPSKKLYVCVWDTGATNTVISKNVVDGLNLQPSGKTNVHAVGPGDNPQVHIANTYLVNLYLPNNVMATGVRVAEGSIAGCDVLIGMDVIGVGDFAVTNHDGKTTWTFRVPSCDEIDFVQEIDEHNKRYGTPLSPEEQRRAKNKRKAERRKGR